MSMKGLVKMRYFLNPLDEEYENIEDLSIYYDSISGQFKHKYKCECGETIGCYCYDSLSDAWSDVVEGMQCAGCSVYDFVIEMVYEDENLRELIDNSEHSNLQILFKIKMDDTIFSHISDEEYEHIVDATDYEVGQTLESLKEMSASTVSKIIDYMIEVDYFDCGFSGYACNT